MHDLALILALGAALVVVLVIYSRLNELFAISVRKGESILLRGRIPQGLFITLSDIARHARLENATIRAVKGEHHARLVFSGVDEGTAQRMRNAFGIHPIHALRSAPAPEARNLGQWLGWSWLAWALLRSR